MLIGRWKLFFTSDLQHNFVTVFQLVSDLIEWVAVDWFTVDLYGKKDAFKTQLLAFDLRCFDFC